MPCSRPMKPEGGEVQVGGLLWAPTDSHLPPGLRSAARENETTEGLEWSGSETPTPSQRGGVLAVREGK